MSKFNSSCERQKTDFVVHLSKLPRRRMLLLGMLALCNESRCVYQGEGLLVIRIPKLSSGTALEPYVRQGDEIATADSAQLVDSKLKALSDSLHPIPTKKMNKVSAISRCPVSQYAMRKIFPTHERLMRRHQSVLDCAAPVRASFIFIVTLSIYQHQEIFPHPWSLSRSR